MHAIKIKHLSGVISMKLLPVPPFDHGSALMKIQVMADRLKSRDPTRVVLACSTHSVWRDSHELLEGRDEIALFLDRKWLLEGNYRQVYEHWTNTDYSISVQFKCEWQHAKVGQWYRRISDEYWEFDADGYLTCRQVSSDDIPISSDDRQIS